MPPGKGYFFHEFRRNLPPSWLFITDRFPQLILGPCMKNIVQAMVSLIILHRDNYYWILPNFVSSHHFRSSGQLLCMNMKITKLFRASFCTADVTEFITQILDLALSGSSFSASPSQVSNFYAPTLFLF